ncbi:DUF3054 domain-containing protein [Mobilicoccus pelagius]|uniref:DUF3054 domain-containing protein n=1 Tax=Mobilicoccus pelagius NBRC 104925 TaxID=1089455 RepID=H5UTG5_9MICO|nr:DUF3054 domain-containing protein [Mobilicoccus pelagius]GAB49023.1 hypothetical protein MOPEL_096_00300 [Mobilicoccus pelagius NBRC 104925]
MTTPATHTDPEDVPVVVVTMNPFVAAALDLVLVVVFAALGRAAHGEAWTGALSTAWPFLFGCGLGWAIWWGLRRVAPLTVPAGVVVWLTTIAGGMAVRAVLGQGTHWSFVVVSLLATAIFLLGWRAIAAMRAKKAARTA